MGKRVALAPLFIGLSLWLAGCGLLAPSLTSQITGYVVSANSGPPVASGRVAVRGLETGFATTIFTDGRGRFSLRVPADRYELTLSKRGYAGSQVIGLDAQTPKAIRIVQREVFNPSWSTRPPVIDVQGIKEGDRFQGEIPYRVDVSGDNDIQYIYVALGKMPGASFLTHPRYIFAESSSTGDQAVDPRLFGVYGPTTFEVVVYDVNGNRTHLIRRIVVEPPEGLVTPPGELSAVAVTLGNQIEFFGLEGQAAPVDANVYVELDWRPSRAMGLTGYRVYRSFDGEDFEAIATTHAGQTEYKDSSPTLAVGKRIYYRVTAFRGTEESDPSNIARTRPLETFSLELVSPSDGEANVSRIPTFRWRPTRRVALYHIYGVVLWDTVLGDSSFWVTPDPPEFLINRTSYRWNEDNQMTGTPWEVLQPQRTYEWEVAYAIAANDLENPTAVSVAINRFGLFNEGVPIEPVGLPATDNFSFTTGD